MVNFLKAKNFLQSRTQRWKRPTSQGELFSPTPRLEFSYDLLNDAYCGWFTGKDVNDDKQGMDVVETTRNQKLAKASWLKSGFEPRYGRSRMRRSFGGALAVKWTFIVDQGPDHSEQYLAEDETISRWI